MAPLPPIGPGSGGPDYKSYFNKLNQQAVNDGKDMAAEIKRRTQAGQDATRSSLGQSKGNQAASKAHQMALDSKNFLEQQASLNQANRGFQQSKGGGGQGGGKGGQPGGQQGGQQGGQAPGNNQPGQIDPSAIPGSTPPGTDPSVLAQTAQRALDNMSGQFQSTQQFLQSQAGNAGAAGSAAAATFNASKHLIRRPPPGIALNGVVVAIVVVVMVIYLTWMFAAAYSEISEENEEARKALDKVKQDALSEVKASEIPPNFGKMNPIPRRAGG
ncbi:MAG: hypothetical protein AAGH70_05595 [Pseudomonadota bacterium]